MGRGTGQEKTSTRSQHVTIVGYPWRTRGRGGHRLEGGCNLVFGGSTVGRSGRTRQGRDFIGGGIVRDVSRRQGSVPPLGPLLRKVEGRR